MSIKFKITYASIFACLVISMPTHAATFVAGNALSSVTQSNDFSGIGSYDTPGYNGSYTQDGISVAQINGDIDDIWTTCGALCSNTVSVYSWYPSGGDSGYTRITEATGQLFSNVFIQAGMNWTSDTYLNYDLLQGGIGVLSGSFLFTGTTGFSFIGGGFDTINLSGSYDNNGIYSGQTNALAIDLIQVGQTTSVPEPATIGLMGLGFASMAARRRKSV